MGKPKWNLQKAATVMLLAGPLTTLALNTNPSSPSPGEEKESGAECRLYLAKTTIPNAGMGLFAGVDFEPDDVILYGDIAVPLDNMPFHTGSNNVEVNGHFIWGDYTWDTTIADGMDYDYEGVLLDEGSDRVLDSVEIASFGLGAMPNCKFGFVNLHSTVLIGDSGQLDRWSPGNGAITPYHARKGLAAGPIVAGTELFENYGDDYFDERVDLSHVPRDNDYKLAARLIQKLGRIRDVYSSSSSGNQEPSSLMLDLYAVVKSAWTDSRVMNALPSVEEVSSNASNLDLLINKGPKHFEKKHTRRDVAWLKEHGQCMDGIRSGVSTIPEAGRGAFATRYFTRGSKIAPVPLIHITDKSVFDMYTPERSPHDEYEFDEEYGEVFYYPKRRNVSDPIQKALMMNYCFGHKNSTLLLSPYGSITSLINHGGRSEANSRMVWAYDWMGHPEWLKMTPDELSKKSYAGMGWDLVALRDIEPGEEILIDYGPEWEEAWAAHTKKWNAHPELYTGTSLPYIPATKLNERIEQVLIDAIENNIDYSYLGHGVVLYCYMNHERGETSEDGANTADLLIYRECRPVSRHSNMKGETVFTAEIVEFVQFDDEDNGYSTWELNVQDVLFSVPASNFHFEELPYNTAHRMPWAFRHEMMVPDDLFPDNWMNLNYG